MNWKVRAERLSVSYLEVEADSSELAEGLARVEVSSPHYEWQTDKIYCQPQQHLSEDGWVSGGWYDLHGPGDVVVFNRSLGNVFTATEIILLQRRLCDIGLTVVDSWNGIDCNTVSFRCTGRRDTGPFDEHVTAFLTNRRDHVNDY